MNFQEVYKRIVEDVNYLVTRNADALNYDKTFRAQVVSKVSAGNYKVLHKKKEYPATCDFNLNMGDIVWVCAPENNWNSLFIQSANSVGKMTNSLKNYEFREDGIYLNGVKVTK